LPAVDVVKDQIMRGFEETACGRRTSSSGHLTEQSTRSGQAQGQAPRAPTMSHVRHINHRTQRERQSAGPIVARLKSWHRRRSFLPQQQPSLRPPHLFTRASPHASRREPRTTGR
jgi:hypothetical protein